MTIFDHAQTPCLLSAFFSFAPSFQLPARVSLTYFSCSLTTSATIPSGALVILWSRPLTLIASLHRECALKTRSLQPPPAGQAEPASSPVATNAATSTDPHLVRSTPISARQVTSLFSRQPATALLISERSTLPLARRAPSPCGTSAASWAAIPTSRRRQTGVCAIPLRFSATGESTSSRSRAAASPFAFKSHLMQRTPRTVTSGLESGTSLGRE